MLLNKAMKLLREKGYLVTPLGLETYRVISPGGRVENVSARQLRKFANRKFNRANREGGEES